MAAPTGAELLLPPVAEADRGKLCVVLDLDETLVQNRLGPGSFAERPHLRRFLGALQGRCELVLWTSSRQDVAEPAVERIDANRSCFQHVIYRDSRWYRDADSAHPKDLCLLGRDRVVVVENSADCVALNPELAIMVEDFWGLDPASAGDECLLKALRVLDALLAAPAAPVADVIRASPHLVHRSEVDECTGRALELRHTESRATALARRDAELAAAADEIRELRGDLELEQGARLAAERELRRERACRAEAERLRRSLRAARVWSARTRRCCRAACALALFALWAGGTCLALGVVPTPAWALAWSCCAALWAVPAERGPFSDARRRVAQRLWSARWLPGRVLVVFFHGLFLLFLWDGIRGDSCDRSAESLDAAAVVAVALGAYHFRRRRQLAGAQPPAALQGGPAAQSGVRGAPSTPRAAGAGPAPAPDDGSSGLAGTPASGGPEGSEAARPPRGAPAPDRSRHPVAVRAAMGSAGSSSPTAAAAGSSAAQALMLDDICLWVSVFVPFSARAKWARTCPAASRGMLDAIQRSAGGWAALRAAVMLYPRERRWLKAGSHYYSEAAHEMHALKARVCGPLPDDAPGIARWVQHFDIIIHLYNQSADQASTLAREAWENLEAVCGFAEALADALNAREWRVSGVRAVRPRWARSGKHLSPDGPAPLPDWQPRSDAGS
eukprot:TRINITY_DN9750_c0_g1_i1.p1 TRINITY_DN9750_c0_g1~~TRINITY_DN9750_c0_g1_i1.p1  ORF type:complete len:703 (+),score=181.57 TRINITY_DN9750_c0_g1_i1:86-2110(+)